MTDNLTQITLKFQVKGNIESVKPLGDGFINDTYIVTTEGDNPNYLLQRKNHIIFTDVPGMMNNIEQVTNHLKRKISRAGGNPESETLTVIKTKTDELFYKDNDGNFWAVALFINDSIVYEVANTPELAFAGGKGIGKFQAMLSDFEKPLIDTLPGFHNIKFRFKQWDEVLKKDPVSRKSELAEEISWIESRRKEMLDFWKLIEDGTIPKRITHNDTKIANILFDKNDDVLCVIDLDTVLSSTVLNDFGDAIRSYTNTGLEDDKNLDNVSMDITIFESYAKGYLSEAKEFLTKPELDQLAFSAKFITYEQVLRFLMDYIDGDKYYKVNSPIHNLERTRAQYKLLQSIESQMNKMNKIIIEVNSHQNLLYEIIYHIYTFQLINNHSGYNILHFKYR